MAIYEYNYLSGSSDVPFGYSSVRSIAQTFTVGTVGTNENFILDSVIVKLKKGEEEQELTGSVRISITEMESNGKPDGHTISTGFVDATTLENSFEDYTVTYTESQVLHAGKMYSIVLTYLGNEDRYIRYQSSNGKTYGGGDQWIKQNGVWYLYPVIMDGDDNTIYFIINGHTTYDTTVISLPIDYNNGNITQATLFSYETANYLDHDDFYNFWMSADGGVNWEKVITGVPHTFTNTGTDLRWKASGATGSTLTGVYVYDYH